MRTSFNIFLVFSLYTLSQSAPVDPDDEVELVPAVKTQVEADYEDDNEDGFIPIFVIRRTSGSPFFGGGNSDFPFSSGFNPFDIFGSQPREEDEGLLIPSIFDAPATSEEEDDSPSRVPCGFLCSILKDFDTKLREIQDEVRDLHDQTNETDGEGEGFGVNNSTYTEKVLPDGTVVKINRTVISDSSDDGSSFFFHSTSLHNFDHGTEEEDSEEPLLPETETEKEEPEEPEEEFEEFPQATEEIPDLDEALNEVPENEKLRFKRSDPFSQQQLVFSPPPLPHPNMIRMSSTWKPLNSDTLVNDIITNNGKRGSLIRIEPDSEFIRENPETGNVETVPIERANLWNQQAI